MSTKNIIFIAITLTILSGCATKTQTTMITSADGSSVEVAAIFTPPDMNNNRYADTSLREVTPVHSGTGMGLAALTAVLSGHINTGDYDKNNYKGNTIKSMPELGKSYLLPKAKTLIEEWLAKHGAGHKYDQTLYLASAQWSLIYQDLSADNSNYDLTYRVKFYKRPENGSFISAYVVAECAPTPQSAPLEEWRANGYQKVIQVSQKYMDACLLELDNQLPRLLAQKK